MASKSDHTANHLLVDYFAQLVTERVELLAEGPARLHVIALTKRAISDARAALVEQNFPEASVLPVSRLCAADVIAQGWVNLSQASLYRIAETGRIYCVTPQGRNIGMEFPVWQFVAPVPELIETVLARLGKLPGGVIHAFWVCAVDALNELSPAEVLAGRPFETRVGLHPSQRELLNLPTGGRLRQVLAAAAEYS